MTLEKEIIGTKEDKMKEFIVKVKCSDKLNRRDVVKELNNGIHYIVGSGDPKDWYIRELEQTKVQLQVGTRRP